jgi:hypothetical protein
MCTGKGLGSDGLGFQAFFQLANLRRQIKAGGAAYIAINATMKLDGAQGMGGNPQANFLPR